MYLKYFEDLKKGEEGICCCFCCLGTVLLVLCFTVLHNKHKMQLLCKRKCGKSLGHLNTSWFFPLNMHWHVLVVLSFSPPPQEESYPALPGKHGQRWSHTEIFRLPCVWVFQQEQVWRQISYRLCPPFTLLTFRHGMKHFQLNTCNARSENQSRTWCAWILGILEFCRSQLPCLFLRCAEDSAP